MFLVPSKSDYDATIAVDEANKDANAKRIVKMYEMNAYTYDHGQWAVGVYSAICLVLRIILHAILCAVTFLHLGYSNHLKCCPPNILIGTESCRTCHLDIKSTMASQTKVQHMTYSPIQGSF